MDAPVLPDCVVCGTSLMEALHHPVVSHCTCVSRICQACRVQVSQCPTCRQALPEPPTVDESYLARAVYESGPSPCDGCGRFVRPRHAVTHAKACHRLLTKRLAESMQEGLAKDKQYRSLVEENEHLRLRIADMTYRLNLVHHQFRRAFRARYGLPPPPSQPAEETESDASDSDSEASDMDLDLQASPAAVPPPPPPPLPPLVPPPPPLAPQAEAPAVAVDVLGA